MEIVAAFHCQTLTISKPSQGLVEVLEKVPEHYRGLFLDLQKIYDAHHQNSDPLSIELLLWIKEMLANVQGDLFEQIDWHAAQKGIDELKKPDEKIRSHFGLSDELSLEFDKPEYRKMAEAHPLVSDLLTWMKSAKTTLQLTQAQEENELALAALQKGSLKYRESLENATLMLVGLREKYDTLCLETAGLKESTREETANFLGDMKRESDAGLSRCARLVDEAAQIAQKATHECAAAQANQARAEAANRATLESLRSTEVRLASSEANAARLRSDVNYLQSRTPKKVTVCIIS